MEKSKVNLRLGRIYIILPKKGPGFPRRKKRPCILLKMRKGKYLFIQIGSTKITYKPNADWTEKLNYIWDKTKRISYLNIDISIYEDAYSIKHPFKDNEKKYVDLRKCDRDELFIYYKRRMNELEKIRIKKAKAFAFSGDIKSSVRQLKLLKMIIPEKHKNLKPYHQAKKWKAIFDKIDT